MKSNRFFALLLALAMLLSMSALAESVTLTDMTGHEITIDEPVTRIVVLQPSDAEILCALGAQDTIVGRGTYVDYPETILEVPVVASGSNTNIEEILALNPQVVVMTTMSQTEEQIAALEQAGVKVVVSSAQDIAGVYQLCFGLGQLCLGRGIIVFGHLQIIFADDTFFLQFSFILGGETGRFGRCFCRFDVGFGNFKGGFVGYRIDYEEYIAFFYERTLVYEKFGKESADIGTYLYVLSTFDAGRVIAEPLHFRGL